MKKIMFLDDEQINGTLFEVIFKDKYDTEIFNRVDLAEKRIQELTSLDVLVVDYKMPMKNGDEFAKIAKEKFPELKVILATAYDYTSLYFDFDFDYVIRKPWDFDQLNDYIIVTLGE